METCVLVLTGSDCLPATATAGDVLWRGDGARGGLHLDEEVSLCLGYCLARRGRNLHTHLSSSSFPDFVFWTGTGSPRGWGCGKRFLVVLFFQIFL